MGGIADQQLSKDIECVSENVDIAKFPLTMITETEATQVKTDDT